MTLENEPKVGNFRTITTLNGYKVNQIYTECPLCHEKRWTERRNGVARYPICRHHDKMVRDEQFRNKLSIGLKNSYKDPIKLASHCSGQKKRYGKQEERDLQSERRKLYVQNHPEYRECQSADSLERFSNPTELDKLKVAQIERWQRNGEKEHSSIVHKALWDNPIFADKMLDCLAKGNTHKQTKHEKVMESILNEYFPNQWEYTGNRTVKIGRKYPDFTHNNGSNLLIECFGDYWHGTKRGDKLRYDQTVKGRIELFAKYGYQTLILWEHEILKSPRVEIADRVRQFMNENIKREGDFSPPL